MDTCYLFFTKLRDYTNLQNSPQAKWLFYFIDLKY